MDRPRTTQQGLRRPKGKTPAERSEEHSAAQRRLKEQAAERRAMAERARQDQPTP